MKLTETDKNMLKEWGYSEENIPQIEKAIRVSNYFLYKNQEKALQYHQRMLLNYWEKNCF